MLERGKRDSLGAQTDCIVVEVPLNTLLQDDPFSPTFAPHVGNSPHDLSVYLIALQQQAYHSNITKIMPARALQRNIKLLLKKYSVMQVKRAIRYSVVAKYPCSTKFIEYLIKRHFTNDTELRGPETV